MSIKSKHQKHAKLKRSNQGFYHRHEFALMGTTCDQVSKIFDSIKEGLPDLKAMYIDTAHEKGETKVTPTTPKGFLHRKASTQFTSQSINDDEYWYLSNAYDFVIVNGNHHQAERQLLVIDSRKDLSKKMSKISAPFLILCLENETVPDYIVEAFPDIPVFDIENKGWLDLIKKHVRSTVLNGLVLAGGKSTRMGKDKGLIEYHGMRQRDFAYGLLKNYCSKTFLSLAHDHNEEQDPIDKPFIKDKFIGLGVYGALLSAFQHDPDAALLVVATDLPFIDKDTINYLIEGRNKSKLATAFYNPETDFPDPILTIWEPRAYPVLLQYLSKGYSCPRKVLINCDIELIKIDYPQFLTNVNTPEQRDDAFEKLKNQ